MHIEAIRLREPGFILAFPLLPGTSRVDTPPGVCAWGPGGSGHVDISGSVQMPGAGSGPAPAPRLPGGPDYLPVWTGRCDPRRKSGAPGLDVKALSYYWRGVGSSASCALALSLLAHPSGPKSTGHFYRGGIRKVDTAGDWPPSLQEVAGGPDGQDTWTRVEETLAWNRVPRSPLSDLERPLGWGACAPTGI